MVCGSGARFKPGKDIFNGEATIMPEDTKGRSIGIVFAFGIAGFAIGWVQGIGSTVPDKILAAVLALGATWVAQSVAARRAGSSLNPSNVAGADPMNLIVLVALFASGVTAGLFAKPRYLTADNPTALVTAWRDAALG
jgi:hypothetical protein